MISMPMVIWPSPMSRTTSSDTRQRVVGRIGLLIRTAYSLVVMDHKLAGKNDGSVKEIMATWAPQLGLYATAIARISGKPPEGTSLDLPLEGSAVRVMGAAQAVGRAPPEGKVAASPERRPRQPSGGSGCCGGSVLASVGPLRAPSPAHA